jgi:hypothetical protein
LILICLLTGKVGVVECVSTTDGTTVEDIGCELINISNFERVGTGADTAPTVKQLLMGTTGGISMEETRGCVWEPFTVLSANANLLL